MSDNHLLPRGTSLPGRVCSRGHLTRRHGHRHSGKRWHRPGCRAEGHIQAVGAGHIGGEALHPQWV